MNESTLAMFGMPGGIEWIVIGIVALLLFGRRLPDVARSLGKSIVEFKKGIKDVKDDLDVRAELRDAESIGGQAPKKISTDEPKAVSEPKAASPQQESSEAGSSNESKPGVS